MPETVDIIRRALLAILILGLIGTATELLLLQHHDGPAQFIPLVLIALALIAIVWHEMAHALVSLRLFQAIMGLFVAAGGLGMYLHYRANVEFQREVDPSIAGGALIVKAMTAKAPPALAPGSMSQLGLIGLAYAYRYPTKGKREKGKGTREKDRGQGTRDKGTRDTDR